MEWSLGFPWELIADGEYDHVSCGQALHTFALEFWSDWGLRAAREHGRQAMAAADYRYKVLAEVIFTDGKACVIDFGLKAVRYARLLPRGAKEGDFVAGTIYVGVPIRIEMVPQDVLSALSYDWRVNRISARERYRLRTRYRDVKSTAALRAEHYVLHCTMLAEDSSAARPNC